MKTNSLSAWILAIRPYSLSASAIPVLAASALAYSDGAFKPIIALLCLIFALLMQCTANLVNDLWDFLKGSDQPDRLGPDRAFAKGYITLPAMKKGIAAFTLAACAAGCGLLFYAGWWLIIVGLICVIFAYFYTAGPYPLAYHGLGDVAVILFFGLIPVGFTYYLQTGGWNWEVVVVAMACGLVIDTMLMVNNFRDREEDAQCDKRTIVVCLGAGVGRWGYLALGTTAVALCLTLLWGGRTWAALLPLIYWGVFYVTWRKMIRIDHGEELNVCLGETARNMLLFGLLLTIGILLD
ncbi:MAG: 1,4-dihydroxy-2-naphthoate octaprenyltransferase [Alistipes sp.]